MNTKIGEFQIDPRGGGLEGGGDGERGWVGGGGGATHVIASIVFSAQKQTGEIKEMTKCYDTSLI